MPTSNVPNCGRVFMYAIENGVAGRIRMLGGCWEYFRSGWDDDVADDIDVEFNDLLKVLIIWYFYLFHLCSSCGLTLFG